MKAPNDTTKPTPDEQAGMDWWNGLTEKERGDWLRAAGSAVPADAWAAFTASQTQPRPRPFESPLSEGEVFTLATLMLNYRGALSGNITSADAAKVMGAWAWLMVREREREREDAKAKDADIQGIEYIQTLPSRDTSGVLLASDIVTELLASPEMQKVFGIILAITQVVSFDAPVGTPFGALDGYASRAGGRAERLLKYLRAREAGDPDPDQGERMQQLHPWLRAWANTLPKAERSQWLAKSIQQIKQSLDAIQWQGWIIWNGWGHYLDKLGYRLENFDPAREWDLPVYEPFAGRGGYTPPGPRPRPPIAEREPAPGPRK